MNTDQPHGGSTCEHPPSDQGQHTTRQHAAQHEQTTNQPAETSKAAASSRRCPSGLSVPVCNPRGTPRTCEDPGVLPGQMLGTVPGRPRQRSGCATAREPVSDSHTEPAASSPANSRARPPGQEGAASPRAAAAAWALAVGMALSHHQRSRPRHRPVCPRDTGSQAHRDSVTRTRALDSGYGVSWGDRDHVPEALVPALGPQQDVLPRAPLAPGSWGGGASGITSGW